jgi:hypothetical protein
MKKTLLYFAMLLLCSSSFAQYAIGNRKLILIDKARTSRSVLTFVYYPASVSGENVPVISDGNKFPVISFGHGFVMSALAYQWLAQALVPHGYIIAFPATEEGVPPIHSEFGKDEVFVARTIRNYGDSTNSFLFGKTNGYTAVGGHSMGGGASFLGMQNVTDITTFFNFAAAETFLTESAIQKARQCTRPALIFAGSKDCVAPATGNSLNMYNNTAAEYKLFANIKDGSHCQFADANKTVCELGETLACFGRTYIPGAEQQEKVLLMLKPWLDFWTKRDCNAISTYYANITANLSAYDTLQSKIITCSALDIISGIRQNSNTLDASVFPNPSNGNVLLQLNENYKTATLELFDLSGKLTDSRILNNQQNISLDYARLPKGLYQLRLSTEKGIFTSQLILE